MDEESLQAALQASGAQLQQVELALGADLDPAELADLRQLQGDLKELIALTEASLVSVRKSKLLATLDEQPPAAAQTPPAAAETEDPPQGEGEEEEQEDEEDTEEDDAWAGRRVQAPFRSAWGPLEYHNAMVVGAEAAGVRVLCLYPTQPALKPCPFFLDGKCRFQDSCR